jgi:hypothetical protein
LRRRGGCRQERSQFLGGRLEAGEFFHGGLVCFFDRGDGAMEAGEDSAGLGVSLAELGLAGAVAEADLVFPQMGLDAMIAAEEPFVANQVIDLEALFRGSGGELAEIFVLKLGEFFARFSEDELRIGIEAGSQGGFGGVHWRTSFSGSR